MGVYRCNVVIKSPVAGGDCINSWHVRTLGEPGVELNQLNDAAGALEDFYLAIRGFYGATTSITHDGDWVAVTGQVGAFIGGDSWTTNGQGNQNALPPHLAVVAGWGTSLRRRSGYGRTFLGPLTMDTAEGNGTPAPAVLTTIRTAMDALIEASDSVGGWAITVYSRKDGVARDIVSRTVHDQFAVMRSRRP